MTTVSPETGAPPAGSAADPDILLGIENLKIGFQGGDADHLVPAVTGVDLTVRRGRTLGLVGESGSGKTVTCLSILRLLPERARVVSGRIAFEGNDLLTLDRRGLAKIRGRGIAMIFQDPMTSLNPVHTIGWQIAEALRLHERLAPKAAAAGAVELLDHVGIPDPHRRVRDYPHQLSGGMNQRAMIALALACRPKLLIADEPTTALDVTIQAQILELLARLKSEMGLSMILVTHDLGVVAQVADDVAVMYSGKVVENAPVTDLFESPRHPYTAGLIASLPRVEQTLQELPAIPGQILPLDVAVAGCRFRQRCERAVDQCATTTPTLTGSGHGYACFNPCSLDATETKENQAEGTLET